MSAAVDRLRLGLLACLPQHLLSRLVRTLTHSRVTILKNLLIGVFLRLYKIDLTEAEQPDPRRYESFNAFFTRALRAGARPIAGNPRAICSPVDGRISQIGKIHCESILQAKGHDYSLTALLGGDRALADRYLNGNFATLYLSPRNYHRIHMPLAGTLKRAIYIPGRLYPVNAHAVRALGGVFTRNERLVTIFDTAAGDMALIMVGALFVGFMETVWGTGREQQPGRRLQNIDYRESGIHLEKAQEMGRFNMGSTVILLFPAGRVAWVEGLGEESPLRMGQELGLSEN
ncbi:MAG TPA: archaetidylserine decarboxylase [Gammaproteobacteria bacterium]|nr:archaetidylserine decarboxylase [Gammaproteobacteria bacterium]